MRTLPAFREAGSGPGVVCLHANASTSGQWRGLLDRLAPTHHVLAPDSYGSGKSIDWPSDREIALDDEVDFIEPVLARAGAPLVLVGHSYGAAIALVAALRHPDRVRALALYEPTLFSLIEAESPSPNAADGIRAAVAASAAALDRGDGDAAAEAFIDYWMGPGSWAATPASRKAPIADSVRNVRRWAHALVGEPTPLAAFGALRMPVLCMIGGRTTASARGVAERLVPVLPNARRVCFDALGHMGPITDPAIVDEAIVAFLASL
jgi:pimeloyl-ACP methyl ester carboxylesterase